MAFGRFIRIVFVMFSLYLLGDAFYRWDGFSYYASFSEFIPSVSLAFVLWSVVAALVAFLLWLLFSAAGKAMKILGVPVKFDHLLLYLFFAIVLAAVAWKVKKLFFSDMQTSLLVKVTVLAAVFALSGVLTRISSRKAGTWSRLIQECITPLVWIFGVMLVVSIPLVGYHAWINNSAHRISGLSERDVRMKSHGPNILLVTFDALAARNMSVYGYERETTPFISSWARNASLFLAAESASNFTTPAVASLMTGKRVWTHQTFHVDGTKPIRSNIESLPILLKERGYFNVALVSNPFASVRMLGLADSFDVAPPASEFGRSHSLFGWKFGVIDKILYRLFGEQIKFHNWILSNEFILSRIINVVSRNVTKTEVPADILFNQFISIIKSSNPGPFFAWIHVFPPHDPYLPPQDFAGTLNSSRSLRSYDEQERLIEESYKYLFQYRPYPEAISPSVNLLRDYYDEFVTYIDREFEYFIEELNQKGFGNNTVIILSADHGESFDHGYFTHGGPFLFEQVTHIPLIIREPGESISRVIKNRVEQIDIPATILDLAGVPVPEWIEGRSLVPFMRGKSLPSRPAFSMNFQQNRSRGHQITRGSIAVWEGEYKLIHYLERDESLLFNLEKDPGETSNMIHSAPILGKRLLSVIMTNLNQANE